MKFVPNWRQAWRWWSVRLTVIAGAMAGYLATPDGLLLLQKSLAYFPEHIRPLMAFLIVSTVPTIARLIQQEINDAEAR